MKKRCTNSPCRRWFRLELGACPYCGKTYRTGSLPLWAVEVRQAVGIPCLRLRHVVRNTTAPALAEQALADLQKDVPVLAGRFADRKDAQELARLLEGTCRQVQVVPCPDTEPNRALLQASQKNLEFWRTHSGCGLPRPHTPPAEPRKPAPIPDRDTSVLDLDLGLRTKNCLYRGGVQTAADLLEATREQISGFRNMSPRCVQEAADLRASWGVPMD